MENKQHDMSLSYDFVKIDISIIIRLGILNHR